MIIEDEQAHPLQLYREVAAWFEDIDDTEPETLRVVASNRGFTIPRVNLDKVQAVINLRTMAMAATDAEVFENTITAFNDVAPVFGITQDCSPHQLVWGLTVIDEVLNTLNTPVQWHEIVDREPAVYTAAMCFEYGLVRLPPILSFAQEALTSILPPASKDLLSNWEKHSSSVLVKAHEQLIAELDDYIQARRQDVKSSDGVATGAVTP